MGFSRNRAPVDLKTLTLGGKKSQGLHKVDVKSILGLSDYVLRRFSGSSCQVGIRLLAGFPYKKDIRTA